MKKVSVAKPKKDAFRGYAFIVNPASKANRSLKLWAMLEEKIKSQNMPYQVFFTEKPKHATIIARQLVEKKMPYIVAVGGDGTVSEVAAGFFDEKGQILKNAHHSALGIINIGSGCDFAKTVKIPKDFDQALAILKAGKTQYIDMGLVKYLDFQGKKALRPFINIADVGIGGEVVKTLERQGKWGGPLAYLLATLRTILRYQNKKMKITVDDSHSIEGIYQGVVVANGKYFGSGMMIAPQAEVNDGYFEIVLLGNLSKLKTILQGYSVRVGKHIRQKEISVLHGRKVRVECPEDCLLDLDGELLGKTPVEFQILPNSIQLICQS